MIKAVILDLDDTLCLTEEVCFRLENETLEKMGRPPMSREIHLSTWGQPLFNILSTRSPGIDVEEFRKTYAPLLKRAIESGSLDKIPKVNLEAIDKLLTNEKSVLVLTSREHTELQHMLLPGHDLAKRVTAFYYKDNMQYHKPDPRAFAQIDREHGWKPEECVYVGDSLSDAESAKGAGLHFIASLESGLRTKSDFAKYSVDAFINVFPEVIDAILTLDRA